MQLPFLSKNKHSDKYLGLLLKEDQGIALVISAKAGATDIVDFEKFSYSNGWDNLTEDIDEVLYRLETKHKIRLEETIFFIYSHLIDEKTNQIKKHYQQKIKNLAKDLELKPLGFIDCREAVVKTIEDKDENRFTGILIELDKNNLSTFIYKSGQVVFLKNIPRTENLIGDLNLVFDEVKGKMLLPTRFVLYNSKDLDVEVTKIVSHHWSSDLFIQLPRVEIVPEKEVTNSLADLFSQQIKLEQVARADDTAETAEGFVIGQDIKDKIPEEDLKKDFPTTNILVEFFRKIRLPHPKLAFKLPNIQKRLLIPFGIIIIIAGLLVNEYFFHKVKIKIFVPSENLKKTLNITAGETSSDDLIIKLTKKTVDIATSKAATGKKDVGDPARGEVTLYNFSKEKEFPKNTKITSNNLSFTLDDDVKVASASITSDGSAKLPGKTKVKVTAVAIGVDSNLTKGQTFAIDGLEQDVYFAKNEADFSGGSKKQITTVSAKDYEDLEAEVSKKSKQEKASELDIRPDEKVISQLTTSDLAEKTYSKEIGEEAGNVTLNAKVVTSIYTYNKSDLIDLIYKEMLSDVKTGYSLDKKNITYQIDKVEEKKRIINLAISAEGKAIKNLDKNSVIKTLLGKPDTGVEQSLKKNFEITGYNINQKQPLAIPFYKNLLPFFTKNFEIEIGSL